MAEHATQEHDQDEHQTAAKTGGVEAPAGTKGGGIDRKPGGKDALGTKENLLSPWYDEMVAVANQLASQFKPLGLEFRPQILLATAMQEAANKDPLNAKSFDNGLGIMQITPYQGKLDADVAKAIGWDNSKSVSYNIQHSRWRDAKSNLLAGGHTMLGKAKAIKAGVPKIWGQMDEKHKWRAVLFAYNAGQGSAISALRNGGPNAAMISTYTAPNGQRVSHDYTKEIQSKIDYVEGHDPFDGVSAGKGADGKDSQQKTHDDDKPHPGQQQQQHIKHSVGRGGKNDASDVRIVQQRLKSRGIDPGPIDGEIGPKTIHAIEVFQKTFFPHPDGLIEPGQTTEKHLFHENTKVNHTPKKDDKKDEDKGGKGGDTKDGGGGKGHDDDGKGHDKGAKENDHPTYAQISKNFGASIPGSKHFTWHEALYLPSWGRHVKPSDVTNASMESVLANIEKQAQALDKLRDHFGKSIVVHCWLRPPQYNKQIGGASNSAHLRGTATDFHVEGMSAEQVRQAIRSGKAKYPGAGELGVSWVHLDLEHHTWFNP